MNYVGRGFHGPLSDVRANLIRFINYYILPGSPRQGRTSSIGRLGHALWLPCEVSGDQPIVTLRCIMRTASFRHLEGEIVLELPNSQRLTCAANSFGFERAADAERTREMHVSSNAMAALGSFSLRHLEHDAHYIFDSDRLSCREAPALPDYSSHCFSDTRVFVLGCVVTPMLPGNFSERSCEKI